MKFRDARVKSLTEILQGVQIVKVQSYPLLELSMMRAIILVLVVRLGAANERTC